MKRPSKSTLVYPLSFKITSSNRKKELDITK